MCKILIFTLLTLSVFGYCISARILVYIPTPSISHQIPFRVLTQELAKRGHEVIVVTTDPAFPKGKAPANLTEIDVHEISYADWHKFVDKSSGKKEDIYDHMKLCHEEVTKVIEIQLNSNIVKNVMLDSKPFDVLLLEDWVRPSLVMSYVFKAPVISISSLGSLYGDYAGVGVPVHPILYPPLLSLWTYNLTLWDKLKHIYSYLRLQYMYKCHRKTEDEMIKRVFGPNIPNIEELSKNIDLYLMNLHPIWGLNIPVPPSVIHMGGIHKTPPKELPEDLKKFLDSSKKGVIYVSLGTNVKSSLLPKETLSMMIKVLSEQAFEVLWKYDGDQLPGNPKNIRIAKWFPQPDLLSHPNVKLFITQGGLQSTDEAIIAGVPLIGLPMLADQWYNVDQYVRHGIGIRIDMDSITEDQFKTAISDVTENESYRRNIVELRSVMYDQLQPPLERAVWWIEHVIRHGGAKHLRAPAANMSWTELLELKLVSTILIIVTTIALVVSIAIYYIVKVLGKKLQFVKKIKSQ